MFIAASLLEYPNCLLCKSDKKKEIYKHRFDPFLSIYSPLMAGYAVRWQICQQCSFVYQHPRLKESFYRSLYLHDYHSEKVLTKKYFWYKKKSALSRRNWFIKNSNIGSGSLLEIGFCEGLLLKAFEDKGWSSFGCEPTDAMYKFSKEKLKLENVKNDFFRSSLFNDIDFDAICIVNVLEHIYDPFSFLSEVVKCVNDNTFLYLVIPDVHSPGESLKTGNFGAPHAYCFSTRTIESLLGLCSIKVIFSEVVDAEIRIIAQKAENVFILNKQQLDFYKEIKLSISKSVRVPLIRKIEYAIKNSIKSHLKLHPWSSVSPTDLLNFVE